MAVRGEIHLQLNVDYADDPKMRALARYGSAARRCRDLYVQMIAYCKRTLSDGHVPAEQVGILVYPDSPAIGTKDAACLVEVGLIQATDTGYFVPAFLRRNPSRQQVQQAAQEKADKNVRAAGIGNHRRWHEKRLVLDPEQCVHCRDAIARRDHWTIAARDSDATRSDRTETETESQTESETGLDSPENPPPPNPPAAASIATDPAAPPAAAPPPSRPAPPAAAERPDAERRGQLVAELQRIRPEWQAASIHRVLADPKLTSVPWQRLERALLAVAADSATQGPGRVLHDGPWWAQQPTAHQPASAPCGKCSPTRRREDDEGRDLGPCPDCHPSVRR